MIRILVLLFLVVYSLASNIRWEETIHISGSDIQQTQTFKYTSELSCIMMATRYSWVNLKLTPIFENAYNLNSKHRGIKIISTFLMTLNA